MSSSTSIALTKIRPPRPRAHLVPRPALERRLGEAFANRRLTVLCAPAGFGKTAALTRQIGLLPSGTALAWIDADEDDDLHRFLECLIAALEPFDLPWRQAPDALIAAAVNERVERRAVASELLNALATCDAPRGLIVIDDAHRIKDTSVFEFVDLLLERLPERWGFVIGSRIDPPLALARLRAQGDLVEIRQADLRLAREEIAAVAAALGNAGAISAPEMTNLLSRTRGWAAGVRLALNTTPHGPGASYDSASRALDRHVFDYLAAEVLDGLPDELRTFLIRCSVLPELTASRCAIVSGNPRAAQLLDEVERRDLFVSALQGPELTLTLHDLFRDCLNDRLRRDYPDEVPQLLRAAASSEPDPIRRLSFLLSAGDWEEAESTLDEIANQLLSGGVFEVVPRLIAQFPPERRKTSPSIALVRALTAWERWEWQEMREATRIAVAGFTRLGDESRRQRALVLEAIAFTGSGFIHESAGKLAELPRETCEPETQALLQALHAWHALDSGNFGTVASRFMTLVDRLEAFDGAQVWYHAFRRPLYVCLPGMRAPLSRFVDGVMRRVGDSPTRLRAIADVVAAWLALWRGDLRRAMELVDSASAEARWFGMPKQLSTFLHTFLAAAHAIRGDREAAMNTVNTLLSVFDIVSPAFMGQHRTSMFGHYVFYGIRIADAVGDTQSVRELAARMPKPEHITNAPMLRAPLLTLPARLAAIDGRHAEACDHWARALVDATAIDIIGQAQEARMRYASSLLAVGRTADAAAELRHVFDDFASTEEIGGALLAGPAILSRLASTPWRDHLTSAQVALLRDWVKRVQPAAVPAKRASGFEGLTSRELEILQRIAAGDTNKLIARAFDLSPHTVKRHVANILEKLGACSRQQAAQWYRAQT